MQKKLIYLSLLISLLSLTFACQTDSFELEQDSDSVIELADGRLRVPILLDISEREVVETKISPTDAEKAVKTIDVCVFDANGKVLEKVKGEKDPTNSLRVFAKVLPRNQACKVQTYANIPTECRAGFDNAATLEAVQVLTMSKVIFGGDSIIKNGLPMVSALDSYAALNSTTLTDKVAKLKFAYARIDITVSSEAGFTLSSCLGLNFRQYSYLTERTPLASPAGVFKTTATAQLSGIYLFESPGSTPTDLLIKGTKTGFSEGYYKIRIAYGTNKDTYDIRRGVRYVVNLSSVKGPGYATADEAIANEPANIEYNVAVDDGSSKDVVISNGKYYLGVSNSEFIVCADSAHGVTATTLLHNAPIDKVKTATIQVVGNGITLTPNQPSLTLDNTRKSATINLQTTKIPIKIDLTSATPQSDSLFIRIGDLVKTISIKKIAKVEDAGGTKSLSELGLPNSSIVTMNSLSPRITVGHDKSLVVAKAVNSNYDAYSYAEAFSTGKQGTIRIAVKQTIENVVYYEQYEDESYGFYFRDKTSTLSEVKQIKDTGYGVLGSREDITKIKLGYWASQEFSPEKRVIMGLPDCSLNLYPMSHKDITPVVNTNGVGVFINNAQTTANYIYPNFAKVISTSSAISIGTARYPPFSIRTPKQFQNINAIASIDGGARYYQQERDLNFADTNIGGAQQFTSSIIKNEFKGNYDGTGKAIRNLTLFVTSQNNTDIAIFASLGTTGFINNLILQNLSVTANSNRVACLVARNKGVIQGIHATKCKLVSTFTFSGSMPGVGIIVGENFKTIKNCLVEFHDSGFTICSSTVRVGCIVGCNQENNKDGVSDCCVVATTNPFEGIIPQYTGGIVGFNESAIARCIYLAMGPSYDSAKRPISGGNDGWNGADNTTTDCFFLKGTNYNNGTINGGGEGLTTTLFNEKPDVTASQWNTLWTRVDGYPYPKLTRFKTPERHPVAN